MTTKKDVWVWVVENAQGELLGIYWSKTDAAQIAAENRGSYREERIK